MDLFESFSGDPENSSANSGGMSGGISRRSIMKAGAAAAWSVPLVQVVAAAPAVAVSGSATLAVSAPPSGWNGRSANLPVAITITNTGSVPTTNLQVTCTFDSAWTSGKATATGWAVQPTGVATTKTYTFTASTQVAANATATLSITFNSSTGQGFATNITVTATATNSSNAPGTSIPVAAAK